MGALFDMYNSNPVLYAVIMIKAREYANLRVQVVNKKTGLAEKITTLKKIPRAIYDIFDRPNALQSRWEFFMQRKIFEEVAGNSFTYGNFTLGFKPDVTNLSALWNVWPRYMDYQLTGKYFEATEVKDIIKQWRFKWGAYEKTWEPYEIMHKNKPNTDLKDGLIFGRAASLSLVQPLSNIAMGYESRNVIMANRGMRVMLTSSKKDESGIIALLPHETKAVEDSLKNYGLLRGQSQFFFTSQPVQATPIDQDVMKLGLFDEIATDAMMVCHAHGVPEILLKLYLKGATFENQNASVRRLYEGTLIPEAEDEMTAWESFFGLQDTEWELRPSFNHVPVLQESEVQKQAGMKTKSERLLAEVTAGAITIEEYRQQMGYAAMVDPNDAD